MHLDLRGKFIVLDGPDGAGKSTQIQLLAGRLIDADIAHAVCRDPGGTVIGDRIRSLLLDGDNLAEMAPACETLLFMASRAQLVKEVIEPALARGDSVLCDRFVSATCAFQGAAGFDPRRVIEIGDLAIGDCWPDATIILDIDPSVSMARLRRDRDAMESRPLEFHRKVRDIFREIQDYYPRPVAVVDASADQETVHQRIVGALENVLA